MTIEVAIQGSEQLAAMQLGALLVRAGITAQTVDTGHRTGPQGQEFAYASTSVRHLLT